MPFKTEEDNVIWTPPSSDDIKSMQKAIWENDTARSGVDPELTEELRNKIDQAVENLVPGKGWGVIVHSNEKVYDTIKAITTGPRGKVDIIIPVYNSIHIVKQCIDAVLKRTSWPYHLYIVDDASDERTNDELNRIQMANKRDITLIQNSKNKGFAASVNVGIKAGSGQYVCLLNSDVLVTPLWLTKMLMAHKADPRNQIVCPATNNTAIVNIPLSPGASYLQMNRIFESFAVRRYPEIMPTGFCFLFPRDLLDKIGHFDEAYQNFGEESDFWMKTIHYVDGNKFPRYRAVMADDTYVFHERGSSFSQLGADAEKHLRKLAIGRFNDIWPQWTGWKKAYNINKALGHLKEEIPSQLISKEGKYRICWAVHSAQMCGGFRYIADIVNYINENGGDARVALIKRGPQSNTNFIGQLRTAPIVFENYEDFIGTFTYKVFKKGVVVASTAELSGAVKTLTETFPNLKPVLHVQSYEPYMLDGAAPELTERINKAFSAIPTVISNSSWISKKIKEEYGITPFASIPPGVDQDLFYPRDRSKGDERPTVMVPLIRSLACKGYNRGVELIRHIETVAKDADINIRILTYGDVKNIPIVSSAICLGNVEQTRLANLLGTEVDVFIDPASLHSYGMPALEAVASGVPVVSWDNLGVREYLNHRNSIIFKNDEHPSVVAKAIVDLLKDPKARKAQAHTAFKAIRSHARDRSVEQFVKAMENELNLKIVPRRIVMVVPHLRKHGGPTTMLNIANELSKHGHDVSITTVYTDINPEVADCTELPINVDSQNISKCDLVITNSDNPMCDAISKMPQAKKKIMLKLSHNARFKQLEEQGLNAKWDAVVTSSEWLKQVCQNPTENWNYKPVSNVNRIGWWHYGHESLASNPRNREYGEFTPQKPLVIATLIHQHPSKGTQEAVLALGNLFQEYNNLIRFVGIGEIPPNQFQINLPNFRYKYSPNRPEMAEIMQGCDIWLGASHTEGLGRMALEAMSAGMTCVISNTGAEYARPNENCLVYKTGDVPSMTKALQMVITDPDLRKKLREEGFKTAREMANSEPCMNELEAVIKEIFGE